MRILNQLIKLINWHRSEGKCTAFIIIQKFSLHYYLFHKHLHWLALLLIIEEFLLI